MQVDTWVELRSLAEALIEKRQLSTFYSERLEFEFIEIEKQGAGDYWLTLFNSQKKFAKNKSGLVLPWLLGICPVDPIVGVPRILVGWGNPNSSDVTVDGIEFILENGHAITVSAQTLVVLEHGAKPASDLQLDDGHMRILSIEHKEVQCKEYAEPFHVCLGFRFMPGLHPIPPSITYHPDFPDIDLDFLPAAREPVKQYAAQRYGVERVCSVGSWQKYKPKSALQDVLAALEDDLEKAIKKRHEVTAFTTKLPEEFDEMELETALKEEGGDYDEFRNLYQNNRPAVELAYRAVNMLRTQGQHAAGLIIADRPIKDHIPLVYRKAKDGETGKWVSEWTEGRESQLSKFGFVKFDILGLNTLQYIAECEKLLRQNRGVTLDWSTMDPEKDVAGTLIDRDENRSDISLNDPTCLGLANRVDVETIFQFDTPFMMDVLRKSGVKSFNDLVVLTSLGRPGPLPMIDVYIKRRDGEEDWAKGEHPRIVDILKSTYGVITFQEQLTRFWTDICGFTVPEAEEARKAVAKKKADVIDRIRPKVIAGAAPLVGEEKAKEWMERMETFGRYAFNKCLAGDTLIVTPHGPRAIEYIQVGDLVLSASGVPVKVLDLITRDDELHEFTMDNGSIIRCTLEHRFLCADQQYHTMQEITDYDLELVEIAGS